MCYFLKNNPISCKEYLQIPCEYYLQYIQFFTSLSVFILFQDWEHKIRKAKTLNVIASIINLAILSLRMNKLEKKSGLLAYNMYIEKYLSHNQTIQTKDLLWKCNFHLLIIPCLKHRHEINRLSKDVHL